MMRSKVLADIKLGEKGLDHGGRLPLHHHALTFSAHVRVFVPSVCVTEVDDELLGGVVGVA